MFIGKLAKRASVSIDTIPFDDSSGNYVHDRRSCLNKPTSETIAWLLERTIDLLKQTHHLAMSGCEPAEFDSYHKKCEVAVQLISGELLSPIYRQYPELREEIEAFRAAAAQDGIEVEAFD